MNPRFYLFFAVLLILIVALAGIWVYFHLRARRLFGQDWKTTLSKVIPLDTENLKVIALDLLGDSEGLNGKDGPCELDPSKILNMIGGLKALRDIQTNCDALIELACYCQRLYPEALVVAEELRLNAREIKWHLDRLNAAVGNGTTPAAAFGEYAQRIVTIYYLMMRHLVALYDAYDVPGAHELQASFT